MRLKLILEVIENENLVENAKQVGDYLLQRLQELQAKFPDTISGARGRGLMCAIDLPNCDARDKMRDDLYNENVIILACGDRSIRFRPHLNVSKDEIDLAISKIEGVALPIATTGYTGAVF